MTRTLTIDTASEPGSYARFFAQVTGERFIPEQPCSQPERDHTPDHSGNGGGVGAGQAFHTQFDTTRGS